MASDIEQRCKGPLLHMPFEIIVVILLEWTVLEWFAPAIARQICRYLKEITDSSPNLWSRLFLSSDSAATADGVREWLKRAKSVPKKICLDTEDIDIVLAALEGAKDATSLVYRLPPFKELPPNQEELIRLRVQMPQLRHLYLDVSIYNLRSVGNTFRSHDPFHGAHFPSLTILDLVQVNLNNVQIIPGLLPAIRHLLLYSVYGPILDLVQACSGTLEHLTVVMNSIYEWQPYPHDRICLPNLKVLIVVEAFGIVPNLEAPTLRLISADLAEINDSTRPFTSVVEWITRPYYSEFLPNVDMTDHLTNMPNLQHLMIFQSMETLKLCFATLSHNRRICPYLQSVEVVEFANTTPQFKLDYNLKEYLRLCMAWRATDVPGFSLRFVEDDVQLTRLEQHYLVSLFIVTRHCLSHHTFQGGCSSFEGVMRTFETQQPLSFRD